MNECGGVRSWIFHYISFFDDAILVQFIQDTLFSHELNTIIWVLKKGTMGPSLHYPETLSYFIWILECWYKEWKTQRMRTWQVYMSKCLATAKMCARILSRIFHRKICRGVHLLEYYSYCCYTEDVISA